MNSPFLSLTGFGGSSSLTSSAEATADFGGGFAFDLALPGTTDCLREVLPAFSLIRLDEFILLVGVGVFLD